MLIWYFTQTLYGKLSLIIIGLLLLQFSYFLCRYRTHARKYWGLWGGLDLIVCLLLLYPWQLTQDTIQETRAFQSYADFNDNLKLYQYQGTKHLRTQYLGQDARYFYFQYQQQVVKLETAVRKQKLSHNSMIVVKKYQLRDEHHYLEHLGLKKTLYLYQTALIKVQQSNKPVDPARARTGYLNPDIFLNQK